MTDGHSEWDWPPPPRGCGKRQTIEVEPKVVGETQIRQRPPVYRPRSRNSRITIQDLLDDRPVGWANKAADAYFRFTIGLVKAVIGAVLGLGIAGSVWVLITILTI